MELVLVVLWNSREHICVRLESKCERAAAVKLLCWASLFWSFLHYLCPPFISPVIPQIILLFPVCVSRLGQNLQRLCLQLLVRSLCRPCSHRCYWALPSLPLVMSSRCVSSMACPAPTALTTQASWSPHLHTCSRLCRHTYSIYLTTAQALTTWWGKFTLKCKYVYSKTFIPDFYF